MPSADRSGIAINRNRPTNKNAPVCSGVFGWECVKIVGIDLCVYPENATK